MPVSLTPLIYPSFVIIVSLFLFFWKVRAAVFFLASNAILMCIVAFAVGAYGSSLKRRADRGSGLNKYQYAQWCENHPGKLQEFLVWPEVSDSDLEEGYTYLEKAAEQNYPPAVWLVGVRLKHGIFTPRPPNWTGVMGNSFPQPKKGQSLIDKAVGQLHFVPPAGDEASYYWQHYRNGDQP